jgi:uncharacterized protein
LRLFFLFFLQENNFVTGELVRESWETPGREDTLSRERWNMKVQFAEIPAAGLALEITDQACFMADEIRHCEPARAKVFLQKKGSDRVLFSGELAMHIDLDCDRCLESFRRKIVHKFKVDLELLEGDLEEPVEHSCRADEMDTLYLREPAVDVSSILAQQVFLLVPLRRLCSEECRGLCPQCGENKNTGICRCKPDDDASPFAVLAGLKL